MDLATFFFPTRRERKGRKEGGYFFDEGRKRSINLGEKRGGQRVEHFHSKIRMCISGYSGLPRFDLKSFERERWYTGPEYLYVPSHLHAGTREMNISFLTRDPTANVYISSCYRYFREATCFFLSRFKGSARLTFLNYTHTHTHTHTYIRTHTRIYAHTVVNSDDTSLYLWKFVGEPE